MKTPLLLPLLLLNFIGLVAPTVRGAGPGAPEDNGLKPATATIYVNPTSGTINNNAAGSLGVAIANNGNVIICWGDSSGALTLQGLQQGVWTIYDGNGIPITATQTLASVAGIFTPASIDSKFLAFYRPNGSPIPGDTIGFPKVKANLFGPGLSFGGHSQYVVLEIPELAPIAMDDSPPDALFGQRIGDWPVAQLFNNDGTKASEVLNGFTDDDAQPAGGARIADYEYLSDGNILLVGENRQNDDLVNRFAGANPGQHVVFRIVKPDGTEVKALTLGSANAVPNSMWHGAGATLGRFAIRFDEGGAKMRIFNNDGTPVTGNIDLGTVTGNPAFSQGGRGDEAGFHGNGAHSYVVVNSAVDPQDSIRKAWVAVISDTGTLQYQRAVTDDVGLLGCDRVDGAIDACGRVIAVYQDAADVTGGATIVRGRAFTPSGSPIGGTFYVSETEKPDTAGLIRARRPRAAWRGEKVAVVWESQNNPTELGIQTVAARFFSVAALGSPEGNGLTPASGTFYVNPGMGDNLNNGRVESLGVAIANNGNVLIGWEDDGAALTDLEAVWTLYDGTGTLLTMDRSLMSLDPMLPGSIMSHFLSYFRADGSPVPGYTAFGPKIKANLFGPGLGMGASAFSLGIEVSELADINVDDNGGGDFPGVQLLNDDGTPSIMVPLSGYSDSDAQPPGNVRIGDWDYLSDGNVVIVGESRQADDLVNRFGGTAPGNHATFRIVKPDGTEVKALTLVSEQAVANSIWHGAAVTRGGFAVRFDQAGAKVRLFRNNGTPLTGNIDLATLTGNPAVGQGGRGDSTGFHGNGSDAYVNVNSGLDPVDMINKAWVTVLNADGSLRYSRAVSDDVPLLRSDRTDGAIDTCGRVIAVYDDAAGTANGVPIVRGRVFNPSGSPLGCTFYVSELETPTNAMFASQRPRTAWRGDKVAVIWESGNNPSTVSRVVAGRLFSVPTFGPPENSGLTPASATFYVNPGMGDNPNNGRVESLGVAIANNGNVLIGWEDDGAALTDLEAVWTLYDGTGTLLTMDRSLMSLDPMLPGSIMSHFLSYFRADGSPVPGYTAFGPKIKANLFGPGLGMGASAFSLGIEVSELADINVDDNGGGDFPGVQLLNDDGTPSIMVPLSGYSDSDAQPPGNVRIGDWDYLSDGNVVIVGESRQADDLVSRFGGTAPGNHATFRIVKPDGTEVKSLTLVSEQAVANSIWHGAAVTRGGFAVRFDQGGAKVRLFRNNGTPLTGNIDLATLTENPAVGQGGRGDSTGFHGNGNDAYVNVNTGRDPIDMINKAWVTVLNADGSLRYSRPVSDDVPLVGSDRADGAIDTLGRVLAVYDDTGGTTNGVRIVRGRLFAPNGSALGCTFYVSELETPASAMFSSQRPRAFWRGDKVAVVWESGNNPSTVNRVVTGRIFSVPGAIATVLSIVKDAGDVVISWSGGGTLQSATEITGPWTNVPNAASPYRTTANGTVRFFRVR